jgi:hypothetical protein
MKSLQTRLRRLEARYGPTAPLPWETPGWEQLSEADQLREAERYVVAYPDSVLARKLHSIEALSDIELEMLVANLTAQLGETPCVTYPEHSPDASPDWNTQSPLHVKDICRSFAIGRKRRRPPWPGAASIQRRGPRSTYGPGWGAASRPGQGGFAPRGLRWTTPTLHSGRGRPMSGL